MHRPGGKDTEKKQMVMMCLSVLCMILLIGLVVFPIQAYGKISTWNELLDALNAGRELDEIMLEVPGEPEELRELHKAISGAPSDYDSFLAALNSAIAEANKPGFGGALPGSGLDSTGWAAEGQAKLYKSTGILVGWTSRLGLLVAFYGAIKLGLAFVQDDAGEKVVGLTAMVSGFMVWSVSMSVNKLFL